MIVLDRKWAVAAALPLFLYGLLIALITIFLVYVGGPSQIGHLWDGSLWHTLAIIVSLGAFFGLVYAAFAAIKNRLAEWSYSWISAMLAGLVVSLNLVLDDRVYAFSKLFDGAVVMLVLLLCLVIFGNIAVKGWPNTALLSMGFCGLLGLSLLFFGVAGSFQTYLGVLAAILGLIEALFVYVFLYGDNKTIRLGVIAGLGVINIGVAWIIEEIFRSSDPSRGVSQFWALVVLLTGLLAGGILSGMLGQFVWGKIGLLTKK